MKIKYLSFIVILATTLFLNSCDDSETLEPTEMDSMSRFDFPEGNDPWDKIFEEIYKEHGVQIIYKTFTIQDYSKAWTALPSISDEYIFRRYSHPDTLNALATYMKDSVFSFLDSEVSKKTFLPYLYTAAELKQVYRWPTGEIGGYSEKTYETSGKLDCWFIIPPDNVLFRKELTVVENKFRVRIFESYFSQAIARKAIVPSAEFIKGVDFTTAIKTSPATDDNYFLKRGFVHKINLTTTSATGAWGNPSTSLTTLKDSQDFLNYLVMLCYNPDYEANYSEYPFIIERCKILIDYMKSEYNIDLEAIGKS